jgi:hypothetical protein
MRVNIVSTIGTVKTAGIIFSIIGANHRPAKNPKTTVGKAAMVSMTG